MLEKFHPAESRFLSVGSFETTRPLNVVDLSDEGLVLPSIFDLGAQDGRLAALFMHGFAADISKPIKEPERARYRPTQLVTEYVRTELPELMALPIDGIIYPSSRATGQNAVLFHGSTACIDPGIRLTRHTSLRLDPASVEVIDPKAAAQIARKQARAARKRQSTLGRSAWSDWAIQRFLLGLGPLSA